MTGDLPFQPDPFAPDDFDPFAGFTGGVDQPGTGPFHPPADLFDVPGLALQFGPPPVGGPDDPGGVGGLGDQGPHLTWYDAPHPW